MSVLQIMGGMYCIHTGDLCSEFWSEKHNKSVLQRCLRHLVVLYHSALNSPVLFWQSYFWVNASWETFIFIKKIVRTSTPAQVADAEGFYVSDLGQYFRRWTEIRVRWEHPKQKISGEEKNRRICPPKRLTGKWNYATVNNGKLNIKEEYQHM